MAGATRPTRTGPGPGVVLEVRGTRVAQVIRPIGGMRIPMGRGPGMTGRGRRREREPGPGRIPGLGAMAIRAMGSTFLRVPRLAPLITVIVGIRVTPGMAMGMRVGMRTGRGWCVTVGCGRVRRPSPSSPGLVTGFVRGRGGPGRGRGTGPEQAALRLLTKTLAWVSVNVRVGP